MFGGSLLPRVFALTIFAIGEYAVMFGWALTYCTVNVLSTPSSKLHVGSHRKCQITITITIFTILFENASSPSLHV